jgi:hypothetical protein
MFNAFVCRNCESALLVFMRESYVDPDTRANSMRKLKMHSITDIRGEEPDYHGRRCAEQASESRSRGGGVSVK